jgi:putative CocE/NonD family hydrolase
LRALVDFDVEMRTRDGVVLRSDIYRPDSDAPVPAIVLRTPYNKATHAGRFDGLHATIAAARGYAFVIQDVRGRWASEGEYKPITLTEGPDGYDCIEWVASQPWCDGNIGMIGGSYESLVQFMAAEQQPPALKAICPEFSGDSRRGALLLDSINIAWAAAQAIDWLTKKAAEGGSTEADMQVVMDAVMDPQAAAQHLPLEDLPLLKVADLFTFQEMLGILRGVAGIAYDRIAVPVLMIGGWYDIDPVGCRDIVAGVRASAATERARQETAVIWGPWDHTTTRECVGEQSFGPQALGEFADLAGQILTFFDRHLKGDDTKVVPANTYFLTGVNRWRTAAEWPPAGATATTLYLDSDGGANSADGDGVLGPDAPPETGEDTFTYDPHDPVPSFGGRYFRIGGSLPGPFDQQRVESRPDVLVYTSAPLDDALTVTGNARAVVHFVTSAPDTDVVVKLCDVAPSGLSHNVSDNFIRLRWREGTDEPLFVEPGTELELAVELSPIAHVFRPGHRLRLQVTSSAFPAYDRNMNTGNPEGSDAKGVLAHQVVRHGGASPSRLELDTLPN